jgi:hypothetical protein
VEINMIVLGEHYQARHHSEFSGGSKPVGTFNGEVVVAVVNNSDARSASFTHQRPSHIGVSRHPRPGE